MTVLRIRQKGSSIADQSAKTAVPMLRIVPNAKPAPTSRITLLQTLLIRGIQIRILPHLALYFLALLLVVQQGLAIAKVLPFNALLCLVE